jgi:hypothetical protein
MYDDYDLDYSYSREYGEYDLDDSYNLDEDYTRDAHDYESLAYRHYAWSHTQVYRNVEYVLL